MAWGIRALTKQLVERLWHGAREELTGLLDIPGIKQVLCQAREITLSLLHATFPTNLLAAGSGPPAI